MSEVVLAKREINVNRNEANFDRACDEAHRLACIQFGLDDDGYSYIVKDWERSNCLIQVCFKSYRHATSCHTYTFIAEAIKNVDP